VSLRRKEFLLERKEQGRAAVIPKAMEFSYNFSGALQFSQQSRFARLSNRNIHLTQPRTSQLLQRSSVNPKKLGLRKDNCKRCNFHHILLLYPIVFFFLVVIQLPLYLSVLKCKFFILTHYMDPEPLPTNEHQI
jgi:hypothetical protein